MDFVIHSSSRGLNRKSHMQRLRILILIKNLFLQPTPLVVYYVIPRSAWSLVVPTQKQPRPLSVRCGPTVTALIEAIATADGVKCHRIMREIVSVGLPIVAKRRGMALPGPAGRTRSEIDATL